jgi:type I restriction enzyme, R subunit
MVDPPLMVSNASHQRLCEKQVSERYIGAVGRYDRAAVTERERDTRWRRIDPKLRASGWAIADAAGLNPAELSAPTALTELPTHDGPADYALCADDRVLGVVEAKKLTIGPEGVLTQAERYSRGIRQQPRYQGEYGVPFLYSTNGEVIRFHDVRRELNRSRDVSAFHTPDALRELLDRDLDSELAKLSAIPPHPGLRPYQIDANRAIEDAIAAGQRRMLVTMATGTGKTLMTVNEIYRLMKSGVARRVLFLVDRRALAAQTVRAFGSYEAEPGLKFDKVYPVYS